MKTKPAYFNRFEIDLMPDDAASGSHPGPCDDDIRALLAVPYIARQLAEIDSNLIRAELAEYGAWNSRELADDDDNRARILWIACGNVATETEN